jgi:peptidoglycan-N-acetylglucosamine deacetylase
MLTFRNTVAGFSALLAGLLIADVFLPVNVWFYVILVFVLVVFIILGSINIQAGFYMKSLCFGNRNTRSVVLTFDDGPDEKITPQILDILKENNIKATFFVIGKKAVKYPDILKRIHEEGHLIGGHSYSHHFFFDWFTFRQMEQELKHTADIVFSVIGKKIRLFRPPYGVTNPTLGRIVGTFKYISIGWSLKSNDTVIRDSEQLLSRLKMKLKAGDIILFHDTNPWTVDLMITFIAYLRQEHYSVEQIDQFLNIKAYED